MILSRSGKKLFQCLCFCLDFSRSGMLHFKYEDFINKRHFDYGKESLHIGKVLNCLEILGISLSASNYSLEQSNAAVFLLPIIGAEKLALAYSDGHRKICVRH